ncbi:TetR family transcriptional regulator [Paramagnetospirillum kuznetsovii]|uniref:TetR family transcriptional regulator n=1 Tax=Paramagnetospirillum kuznetsovii TaxID=2053833 RepID=A0A364P2U4_9PROT|nr:TetR/AcrR family transcriptional regulator [Paramagnetospirillum kuznetsovii]RAU23653.1 TetR family transcriptional regulator [Paramagnetospirillum kuznetsovii]
MAKVGRKPSAKREAILDAAQAAFLEDGYAATSMDGVALGACVSKATIYAHFASKDQLFAAVIQRRCERESVFQAPEGLPDARTALTQVARRLLGLLLSPEALAMYRVVVSESMRQPDLARAFYESGPAAGKAQIAEIMAELARRGALTLSDPWQATDMFIGMLRTDLFMRKLLGLPLREDQSPEQVIDTAVDIMMRAYGPVRPPVA